MQLIIYEKDLMLFNTPGPKLIVINLYYSNPFIICWFIILLLVSNYFADVFYDLYQLSITCFLKNKSLFKIMIIAATRINTPVSMHLPT